jgi:hypothetical protein
MQAPPLRLFIQERTKLQGSLARYAQHAVRLRGFTASCSELTQDTYRRSNSFRIDKAILASGSLALLLYRAAGRAITPFGSTASGPAGAGGTITVGPGIADSRAAHSSGSGAAHSLGSRGARSSGSRVARTDPVRFGKKHPQSVRLQSGRR